MAAGSERPGDGDAARVGTGPHAAGARRFYVETLGCPKNAVDSDKVVASLLSDGLVASERPEDADLIVVNTCAFIEAARQESIDTTLALSDQRRPGAQLVVTGCMAERYGDELSAALPEVDAVVGFAGEGALSSFVSQEVAVSFGATRRVPALAPTGVRDLLELPRGRPDKPWAYVKVAEGCDRVCAFCAIPSFRGKQRSRSVDSIVVEARDLVVGGARELVLVAQDLAWYGRDTTGDKQLVALLERLDVLRSEGLSRVRLLYLYPSEVRTDLVDAVLDLAVVVPYFDFSLQHAAPDLLRSMKRWGSGDRFLDMIATIRAREPAAVFRSSFISGFPGETEAQHDALCAFLQAAELDWAGFFAYSREEGTAAARYDDAIDAEVIRERLAELDAVQEPITAASRTALIGRRIDVLVDGRDGADAIGRTYREAPEIDGVVRLPRCEAAPGVMVRAVVEDADGVDLVAFAGANASPGSKAVA